MYHSTLALRVIKKKRIESDRAAGPEAQLPLKSEVTSGRANKATLWPWLEPFSAHEEEGGELCVRLSIPETHNLGISRFERRRK